MKKYIITTILILSMILSQSVNAEFSFTYKLKDVDESTYYYTAIDYFREGGVINGYPDGEFKPDKCVNRVEFLKMLYLAVEADVPYIGTSENVFSDVSEDEWYWPFLSYGLQKKDVVGYPDGTFRPDECVNRVEAIKLAVLAFNNGKVPTVKIVPDYPYDIEVLKNRTSKWWWDYFNYAFATKLVGTDHFERYDQNDFSKYDFEPTEPITRKEVAELLYRTKTVAETDIDTYDEADGMTLDYMQFYRSITSGITFLYSLDWQVISDYYYISQTFTADYPTITLTNKITGEIVKINDWDLDCKSPAICHELVPGFIISSTNPSPEAKRLIDRISLTFRLPETFVPGIATFVNETYDYAFEYPASLVVNSNDYETPAKNAFVVWVPMINLNIEVQDPKIFNKETGYGAKIGLPLKGFAEYVRQENIRIENPNFPDKEVGELKETKVAGLDAYMFDLTYSFETERGGYILYEKYEYYIVNNGTYHVVIWLPASSDAAKATLDSLEFI